MTTIIERPPGTTPGPAPWSPRPWWKKPLTWIIAIVAFGGASLAAYAAVSGSTTATPPAATAPATPSPASPAQPSEYRQIMRWFLYRAEPDQTAIRNELTAVGKDALSLSSGSTTDTTQLSADLATLRHDITVAQADQPPSNYHGFRTDYNAALGHLGNMVADFQQAVTDINSGDYNAAMTDLAKAKTEADQFKTHMIKADGDLTP